MSAFVHKAFSRACFYVSFLVMPIKGVAVNSAQYTDNSDKHSDLKLKSVNNLWIHAIFSFPDCSY